MSILYPLAPLPFVAGDGGVSTGHHVTKESFSYTSIFLTVGLVSMLPLASLASIVSLRTGLPRPVRLACFCTTLTLAFGLAGVSVVYFSLGPIHLVLTRGDQVHLGGWAAEDSLLAGHYHYYRLACSQLTVQTDKLGVRVWAVSLAVNRLLLPYNYSLVLANQSLPAVLHVRLNTGDRLRVAGGINETENYAVLFKGMESWRRWKQVSSLRAGSYEKCCAWMVLEQNASQQVVQVDATDLYTIIIRSSKTEQTSSTDHLFTGSIELSRSRWSPTQCDPLVCDTGSSTCLIGSITYQGYIMEYQVQKETAPPYGEVSVELSCHPRHWAIGLIFSFIPMVVTITIVVVWRCKCKRKIRFSETVSEPTRALATAPPRGDAVRPRATTADYGNAAFEMDVV